MQTVEQFQVLLFKTNYSIQHYSFICTQSNGSNYCFISLTNQLNISHLFTQLNDQTVLFQTVQFNTSHLFEFSLNVKQFYLTNRQDPIMCYHSRPEWTWEWWQWIDTLHSPNFQGWSLTIELFSIISGQSLGAGVLLLCRDAVNVFFSPSRLVWNDF